MHLHFYCEVRGVSPTPIPTVLHNWIRVAPCLSTPKNEAPLVAFVHNKKKMPLEKSVPFSTKKQTRPTVESTVWNENVDYQPNLAIPPFQNKGT